jgi:hypothetical protein
MPSGLLITRGDIVGTLSAHRRFTWTITVPIGTPLVEVTALMRRFGCYCRIPDEALEVELIPVANVRPAPTATEVAQFYERGQWAVGPVRAVIRPAAPT